MWPQGVSVALVGGEKHIGQVYAERGSGVLGSADVEGTGEQSVISAMTLALSTDTAISSDKSAAVLCPASSTLCRFLPRATGVGDTARLPGSDNLGWTMSNASDMVVVMVIAVWIVCTLISQTRSR